MKQIILLVLCLGCPSFLSAQNYPYCKPGLFSENPFYNNISIVSEYDLQYGINLNFNGQAQFLKLNIHYPNLLIDPLPLRPLIVMLHGGGFVSGNKIEMDNYCIQLAKAGYVAATIDYRLGWDSTGAPGNCNGNISQFRYAIYRARQDAHAALRYLVSKSTDFRIDVNQIFVAGQSEGGMTALHLAFMSQIEANALIPGAFADLGNLDSATNNIMVPFQIKGLVNWCGALLDTNIIQNDTQIPLLSIHGLKDSVMPVESGYYLNCSNVPNPYPLLHGPKTIYSRMKNIGICSEANFDANGEHCFYPSLEEVTYIPAKFTCFIKNLMCGNCNTETKTSYNFHSCMESAPVSVSEVQQSTGIELSPNPASDFVDVSIEFQHADQLKIELLDACGRTIEKMFDGNIPSGIFKQRLQFTKTPCSGLYFLKFYVNHSSMYQKLSIH